MLSDRSYAGLQALPTDSRAMLAYLEEHNSCNAHANAGLPRSVAAYAEIFMILNAVKVLPPKAGAALYGAAALIPGITVRRNAADAAGGRGIAVSMTWRFAPGSRARYELVFNSRTYRYLGSQMIDVAPGIWHAGWPDQVRHGEVMAANAVRSYAIVNTAPSRYVRSPEGKPLMVFAAAGADCL